MPINPINFSGADDMSTGVPAYGELVKHLIEGYKAGAYPAEQKQKYRGEEENILKTALANEFEKKYGDQKRQTDIAHTQAQTGYLGSQTQGQNYKNEFPGHGLYTGLAQEAASIQDMGKVFGTDNAIYQKAMEGFENKVKLMQANTEHKNTLSTTKSLSLLPTAERQRIAAILAGAGINPEFGFNQLAAGKSLDDLLAMVGTTTEDVTPNYPLGQATVAQMKNREAFDEEIKDLAKNVNEPLANIGRTVAGYSIPQVVGAITNQDPDSQGKILAARALQPELAALRLKAAGGNVGIEAIREMQHAALGNLNVIEGSISKEAKQAMNKYITQWIDEAVKTYNKSLREGSKLNKKSNNSSSKGDPLGIGL